MLLIISKTRAFRTLSTSEFWLLLKSLFCAQLSFFNSHSKNIKSNVNNTYKFKLSLSQKHGNQNRVERVMAQIELPRRKCIKMVHFFKFVLCLSSLYIRILMIRLKMKPRHEAIATQRIHFHHNVRLRYSRWNNMSCSYFGGMELHESKTHTCSFQAKLIIITVVLRCGWDARYQNLVAIYVFMHTWQSDITCWRIINVFYSFGSFTVLLP